MTDWMVSLQQQLTERTDPARAGHVISRLLPQMLADMNRMAQKKKAGETLTEEYRLDDGSLSITLTGVCTGNGIDITNAACEGKAHTSDRQIR